VNDLPQLGSTLIALLFVVALIGVLALLARRLGFARSLAPLGQARRLSVVEALALDGKRRLVLVRRDGVEHLILLGTATDSVIETAIVRPASPSVGIER
jgi:flagellar protein FliO/FliZ